MLEMLLGDRFEDRVYDLTQGWWDESRLLLAPPLFFAEVTSALRKRVHRGTLPADRAEAALEIALTWRLAIWDDARSLQRSALTFANRFNRPKAYDAQYLALADRLGCELWTADERLANAVGGKLPWVRWIGAGV